MKLSYVGPLLAALLPGTIVLSCWGLPTDLDAWHWDCVLHTENAQTSDCRIDVREEGGRGAWSSEEVPDGWLFWRGPLPDDAPLASDNDTVDAYFRDLCAAPGSADIDDPLEAPAIEDLEINSHQYVVLPEPTLEASRGGPFTLALCICPSWSLVTNCSDSATGSTGLCCNATSDSIGLLGRAHYWSIRVCDTANGCLEDPTTARSQWTETSGLRRFSRVLPQQGFGLALACPIGSRCLEGGGPSMKFLTASESSGSVSSTALPSWSPTHLCKTASASGAVEWTGGNDSNYRELTDGNATWLMWDGLAGSSSPRMMLAFGEELTVCFSFSGDSADFMKVGSLRSSENVGLGSSSVAFGLVAGSLTLYGGMSTVDLDDATGYSQGGSLLPLSPYEALPFDSPAAIRFLQYSSPDVEDSLAAQLGFNVSYPASEQDSTFASALTEQCQLLEARMTDNSSSISSEGSESSDWSSWLSSNETSSNGVFSSTVTDGSLQWEFAEQPVGLLAICYCASLAEEDDIRCRSPSRWLFAGFAMVRGPIGGQVWQVPTGLFFQLTSIKGEGFDTPDTFQFAEGSCDDLEGSANSSVLSGLRATCSGSDIGQRLCRLGSSGGASDLPLQLLTAESSGVYLTSVDPEESGETTKLTFSSSIEGLLVNNDTITLRLENLLVNGRAADDLSEIAPAQRAQALQLAGRRDFQDTVLSLQPRTYMLGHRITRIEADPTAVTIRVAWDLPMPNFTFRDGLGLWTRHSEASTNKDMIMESSGSDSSLKVCWSPSSSLASNTTLEVGEVYFYEPNTMTSAALALASYQVGAVVPGIMAFQATPQQRTYEAATDSGAATALVFHIRTSLLVPRLAGSIGPACATSSSTDDCPAILPEMSSSQAACGLLFSELWSDDPNGFPVPRACSLSTASQFMKEGIIYTETTPEDSGNGSDNERDNDSNDSNESYIDVSSEVGLVVASAWQEVRLDFEVGRGLADNMRYVAVMNLEIAGSFALGEHLLDVATLCSGSEEGFCSGDNAVLERSSAVSSSATPTGTSFQAASVLTSDFLTALGWGNDHLSQVDTSKSLRLQLRPSEEATTLLRETGSLLQLQFWPLAAWGVSDRSCEAYVEVSLVSGRQTMSCTFSRILPDSFSPELISGVEFTLPTTVKSVDFSGEVLDISVRPLQAPTIGFDEHPISLVAVADDGSEFFATSSAITFFPTEAEDTYASLVPTGQIGAGSNPFTSQYNEVLIEIHFGIFLAEGSEVAITAPSDYVCYQIVSNFFQDSFNDTALEGDPCAAHVAAGHRISAGQSLNVTMAVKNPGKLTRTADAENVWSLQVLTGAGDILLESSPFVSTDDGRRVASLPVLQPVAGAIMQPTGFQISCCGEGPTLWQARVSQWLRIFFRPTSSLGRGSIVVVDAPEDFDFGDSCGVRDLPSDYYHSAADESTGQVELRPLRGATCSSSFTPAASSSRLVWRSTPNRAEVVSASPIEVESGSFGSDGPHYGFELEVTHPRYYSAEQQSEWFLWLKDPDHNFKEGLSQSIAMFQDEHQTWPGPSWGLYQEVASGLGVHLISARPYVLSRTLSEVVVYPIRFATSLTGASLRVVAPSGYVWEEGSAMHELVVGTHAWTGEEPQVEGNALVWSSVDFEANVTFGFRHKVRVPSASPILSSNSFFVEFGFNREVLADRPAALSVEAPLVAALRNCAVEYHNYQVGRSNVLYVSVQTSSPILVDGGLGIRSAGLIGFVPASNTFDLLSGPAGATEDLSMVVETREDASSSAVRLTLRVTVRSGVLPAGKYLFSVEGSNLEETPRALWRFGSYVNMSTFPAATRLDLDAEVWGPALLPAMLSAGIFPLSESQAASIGRADRPGALNNLVFFWSCSRAPTGFLQLQAPLGFTFDEGCLSDIVVDKELVLGDNSSEEFEGNASGLQEWNASYLPTRCEGRGRRISITIPEGLEADTTYAFRTMVWNPLETPELNEWSVTYCGEASGPIEGFPLWTFHNASAWAVSYAQDSLKAAVAISFRSTSFVYGGGTLRVEAPPDFTFRRDGSMSPSCSGWLQLLEGAEEVVFSGLSACQISQRGRHVTLEISSGWQLQQGVLYSLAVLADFPSDPGFSGDWIIRSFDASSEALDAGSAPGFDLLPGLAGFEVWNVAVVDSAKQELRPGRTVEVNVRMTFSSTIKEGSSLFLRAPRGFDLLAQDGGGCAGFAVLADSLPAGLGLPLPQCSCETPTISGQLPDCHLEWYSLGGLAAGEEVRFKVVVDNPSQTPRLARNFWRGELRSEAGVLLESAHARSWKINSCLGMSLTATSDFGGLPSMERHFSMEFQNACGGLALTDRWHFLNASGTCGDAAASIALSNLDGASFEVAPGSTGLASTSVRWSGLRLDKPDVYRVCWCSSKREGGCLQIDDFQEPAGQVTVRGVLGFLPERYPLQCRAAARFAIVASGVGLLASDRILVRSQQASCGADSQAFATTVVPAALEGPPSCTGSFSEAASRAGNNRLRPDPGTACAAPCVAEAGRWGDSWCWTEPDGTQDRQWGAPCMSCPSEAQQGLFFGVGSSSERMWAGLALVEAGAYRLCWCAGAAGVCDLAGDFDVDLGLLDVFGPSPAEHHCTMDRSCNLTIGGVPASQSDALVEVYPSGTECRTAKASGTGVFVSGTPTLEDICVGTCTAFYSSARQFEAFRFTALRARGGSQEIAFADLSLWEAGRRLSLKAIEATSDSAQLGLDGDASTVFEGRTQVAVDFALASPTLGLPDGLSFVTGALQGDDENRSKDELLALHPVALVLQGQLQLSAAEGGGTMWMELLRVSSLPFLDEPGDETPILAFDGGRSVYSFGIPSGDLVGSYQLCWTADPLAGDLMADAGTLKFSGLGGLQDQWCFAGASCVLGPVSGIGLSSQDRVRAVSYFET